MVATDPGEGGAAAGRYRFGDIVVDAAAHTVSRAGELQAVEPKSFAVLLALLQRPGELIARDDLLDRVWGHRHVTPGVLTRAIAQLRKALGDDAEHPCYIQTLHSLGYSFIGEVEQVAVETPAVAAVDSTLKSLPNVPDTEDSRTPVHASVPAARPLRLWAIASVLLLLVAAFAWVQQQRQQSARPPASIAVLPFTTLSDDRQDRYFAEGLAAEMHGALAGVHGLKVAAWLPPSARIAGEDVRALGQRLGVATVLDASMRRAGSRVRISARLADTRSGYTLWSQTYDRELADVFATQSDIAQQVATSLIGVIPDGGEGLRRRLTPTRNVAAFDAYLRGVQALLQGGKEREAAAAHFKQALSRDSGFARAQAGLCNIELWRFEYTRNVDAFESAKLACKRAENMDPSIGRVRLAMASLHLAKGDTDKAQKLFAELGDDPEVRSEAFVGLARVMEAKGRHIDAIGYFRQALTHSPGDGFVHASMGYMQAASGDMQGAIASYRRAVELDPGSSNYWSTLGSLLLETGQNKEAEHAMQRSLAIEPRASVFNNLGTLRYQAGDYAEAVRLYRRATELNPGHFLLWGYLGDGLLADPKNATEAKNAFRQAALLAERYVMLKPEDGKALAALGWYRVNLGDTTGASAMVRQSAKFMAADRGDVSLFNAQTSAQLNQLGQAQEWIRSARAAGIPDSRILTNVVLVRKEVVSPRQTQQ